MDRERIGTPVHDVLERVCAFLGGFEPHDAREHDAGEPFWSRRLALDCQIATNLADDRTSWVAYAVRRVMRFALLEILRGREEPDRKHELNWSRELRDPERVDSRSDDGPKVVVNLDVPTGNDPVDIQASLAAYFAGRPLVAT